jgi:hypothetical protein
MYGNLKAMWKSRIGVRLGKFSVVRKICFAGAAISGPTP